MSPDLLYIQRERERILYRPVTPDYPVETTSTNKSLSPNIVNDGDPILGEDIPSSTQRRIDTLDTLPLWIDVPSNSTPKIDL